MKDPLAYFLTWATYGTWLQGDARGWVEYQRGFQLPDSTLALESSARMSEDACRLSTEQRATVEKQIAETCCHRGWNLLAVNCRSNHIHVVVSAVETSAKKVRNDLKAWATRCLKDKFEETRERWWAERGSIRYLNDETSLEAAIAYVKDGQDRTR